MCLVPALQCAALIDIKQCWRKTLLLTFNNSTSIAHTGHARKHTHTHTQTRTRTRSYQTFIVGLCTNGWSDSKSASHKACTYKDLNILLQLCVVATNTFVPKDSLAAVVCMDCKLHTKFCTTWPLCSFGRNFCNRKTARQQLEQQVTSEIAVITLYLHCLYVPSH